MRTDTEGDRPRSPRKRLEESDIAELITALGYPFNRRMPGQPFFTCGPLMGRSRLEGYPCVCGAAGGVARGRPLAVVSW